MSPATGKRYPLTLICSVWRVARSSVYACQAAEAGVPRSGDKRGPKTALSDSELLTEIRTVLAPAFVGEPECNGLIERFIRKCNSERLIEWHG